MGGTRFSLFKEKLFSAKRFYARGFNGQLFGVQCQLCHCDLSADNQWICNHCESSLPKSRPGCQTCATPITGNTPRCGQCLKSPPAIDQLVASFDYQFPINQWLPQFKFSHQSALAKWFAEQLIASLNLIDQQLPEAILPVPLHDKRMRQRGYNQAHLIARHLSRKLRVPLLDTAVKRHKTTEAQSGLSVKQRQINIRQAFTVKATLPKSVAIVDDVFTTGSTVNELSRTLKLHHCQRVEAWVVAHAPLNY